VVFNEAFSVPFDESGAVASNPNVGALGRQRNVVVNNAFSIPFDDDGDIANTDAVVAAAAAAAGFTLVNPDTSTSSADGVGYLIVISGPSAATSNPDYDLSRVGGEVEEEDPAHDYQNVDNRSWDGKVQEGPRDYENAPSTIMVAGGDGTSIPRTTSTSSNALVPYENVFKGSQTSVEAARDASTSSSTLTNSAQFVGGGTRAIGERGESGGGGTLSQSRDMSSADFGIAESLEGLSPEMAAAAIAIWEADESLRVSGGPNPNSNPNPNPNPTPNSSPEL
jgi:hypothetical protein